MDCSTVDPPSLRDMANGVHETGTGCFVDAPVSGGVVGAWVGTLPFMFGALELNPLIERIQSVLSLMGKTSLHIGQQGAGVCSKLPNNYILTIYNISTAETSIWHKSGVLISKP
jgi:3-hydroxyisobutyrate dehydrogenase-like beta-hydroxyacid dehydrogenase